MTYRSLSAGKARMDRGAMIIDALMGTALAIAFASALGELMLQAESMASRAMRRDGLIRAYEATAWAFDGMLPYDSRSATYGSGSSSVSLAARARWYGNDRIETDIEASDGGLSIGFSVVRAYPFPDISTAAGEPLCASDLMRSGEVAHIVPVRLPVDPLLPLTDLVVQNGRAYVSADSARGSDPDLIETDISDPASARLIGSVDTGPGISSIAFDGERIFAAAASAAAQLHIIRDVGSGLSLESRYALPLPTASTSPTRGSSIAYTEGMVYLGTEKWDGDEIAVIDVSEPASPQMVSGAETGSKISALRARNGILYAAGSDVRQLSMYRIVPGGGLMLIGAFSPSGWERQEGKAIGAFEDGISFGRTSGGFDIRADHELFSWASSSDMGVYGSANVPGGIYGIVSDRRHIYAISRSPGSELSVFPKDPSSGDVAHYPLPVLPQAMACDGDRLYILARSAPYIYEASFDAP